MHTPLTIEDNGKSIDLKVGSTIEIHLTGNPTTGYAWSRVGFVGKESSSDDHMDVKIKYSQALASAGMVGVGGTYHVSVTPKHSGQHKVELIYCRSFEGPMPDSRRYTVSLSAV